MTTQKKNQNFKVSAVSTKADPAKEFFVEASSEAEAKKLAEQQLGAQGTDLDNTEIKVSKVEVSGEDGSFKDKDELKAEEKANKEDK